MAVSRTLKSTTEVCDATQLERRSIVSLAQGLSYHVEASSVMKLVIKPELRRDQITEAEKFLHLIIVKIRKKLLFLLLQWL